MKGDPAITDVLNEVLCAELSAGQLHRRPGAQRRGEKQQAEAAARWGRRPGLARPVMPQGCRDVGGPHGVVEHVPVEEMV